MEKLYLDFAQKFQMMAIWIYHFVITMLLLCIFIPSRVCYSYLLESFRHLHARKRLRQIFEGIYLRSSHLQKAVAYRIFSDSFHLHEDGCAIVELGMACGYNLTEHNVITADGCQLKM